MHRYYLLMLSLIFAQTASADQLDGLEHLDTILILGLISAISVLVLFFSLFITIVNRMARDKFKVSAGINFSCATLIICALIAIATLGSQIDALFLLICVGVIALSILFIVLNYKVGAKRIGDE